MKLPQLVGSIPANTIYLPNKYTRWYYCIINTALRRGMSITGYTENHHIIPESFYINRSRLGPKGWLAGDPNCKLNIVKLTPEEHFICHWLLIKMVDGLAVAKMERALTYFKVTNQNTNRILTAGQYARAKLAYSLKGCPQETRQKISQSNTGKVRTAEQNQANSLRGKGKPSNTKGTVWWNDGVNSIRSSISPGDNWTPGLLKVTSKHRWWTNGITNIRSIESPGSEFTIGRVIQKFWHNGNICVQSSRSPGPEFKPGQPFRGKWWNNNTSELVSNECPGKGWKLGRLLNSSKGTLWWNDGVRHKRSAECPGPEWKLGRLWHKKP
jgi:hypothetical protein